MISSVSSDTFITHEPCPKCGSRDNLGVWEDGHKWCFGCGHWEPPTSRLSDITNLVIPRQHKTNDNNSVVLPADFSYFIPHEPRRWLAQYALTDEQIRKNRIGWSQSEGMLIFPYFGEEHEILVWQGRYFPARKPKVFTSGFPDRSVLIHSVSDSERSSSVVVVEDCVSAIKVSSVVDSSPLMGSILSIHKAKRLSRLYSNLILWLDNDKIKEMNKFRMRYAPFFDSVKMVITEQDPKFYNEAQIKEFVNG